MRWNIKPHQFVSYVQNEDIERHSINSKSLWKCLSCFACVERCPRNVQPGKLIDAVKTAGPATERAGVSFPG